MIVYPGDGGTRIFWNTGTLLTDYMVSQPNYIEDLKSHKSVNTCCTLMLTLIKKIDSYESPTCTESEIT
jgi:hypothetical protein